MRKPQDILLQQEIRRVETDAQRSLANLLRASCCRDAVRHLTIRIRPEYKSMSSVFGLGQFKAQAENVLRKIIETQIAGLRFGETLNQNAGLLRADWEALRGNAPVVFVFAHRELEKTLSQLAKKGAASVGASSGKVAQ